MIFLSKKVTFCFAIIGLFSFSCKQIKKDSFGINDSSQLLRPRLNEIVANGIVQMDSATLFLSTRASDKELQMLLKSEHPILRAIALRECLARPTFNHFELIMSHLNDTAIVATNAGEWGIEYKKVSDYMLENARWRDSASRNETIEEVISHHNYLSSAYKKLAELNPESKYRPYIQQMLVQKERPPYGEVALRMDVIGFKDKELALYALAKYQMSADIKVIREILEMNSYDLSDISFELMTDFPDSSYLSFLEQLYPKTFYRRLCIYKNEEPTINYIKCIATYKNERSAKILKEILIRRPSVPCRVDSSFILDSVLDAIWDNQCSAYSDLRNRIQKVMEKKRSGIFNVPIEPFSFPADTSKEPIRW